MNEQKLLTNIIDQIKEAQMKLGFVKETVRLYYPPASICALLGIDVLKADELLLKLQQNNNFKNTVLGELKFAVHSGRMEVCIMPEACEYVYKNVENPPFLADIISLFQNNHHCSLEEICAVFARYSSDYVCEKMAEGTDFDYALHFKDETIDSYYYCVKMEMGHTIYHRFMKEDYEMLLD
jgi:hypothetical protein